MLFSWLMAPESNAYREQIVYRLRGPLDILRFEKAWKALAQRHDILRTVFVHDKADRPLQMVLKEVDVGFRTEDLRGQKREQRATHALACRQLEREQPFDLARELSSRVTVIRLSENEFEVVWTFHHIILDGWSVGLLMADLLRLYAGIALAPTPKPYSHYIKWLEARDQAASREFWCESLAGYAGQATLPSSRPGFTSPDYEAATTTFNFEPDETAGLERFAREQGVTTGALTHALWAILLSRYQSFGKDMSGGHDLVLGTVVSGRPPSLSGVDTMVGLFTNTVPLRLKFSDDDTLAEVLSRVQDGMLAVQEHAYLPLAELQSKSGMVEHVIAYENYPRDQQISASVSAGEFGFQVESVEALEQTPYDLNVVFVPGERLHVTFYFNSSHYSYQQIERLFEQLRTLALAIESSPRAKIRDLDLLPKPERALLATFTNDRIDRAGPKTISASVAQHIQATPDAPAIIVGDKVLTYEQLDRRVAQLGRVLCKEFGLAAGMRVAVAVERGPETPIAWLAIMRAGGVYVPIDPDFPAERTAFMVKDSNCAMVLTGAAHLQTLRATLKDVAVHDIRSLAAAGAIEPVHDDRMVDESAYVIYTSGSTGLPKGVAVGHLGVLNVVAHMGELYPIGLGDRVVFFASPSFDASIWEMCIALCHGAALVIADQATVADPGRFGAFLRHHGCTVTILPPSYVRLLELEDLSALKLLATGGEATDTVTAARLSGRLLYANLYGPTETSIMVTSHVVSPRTRYTRSVPIGAPIPNVEALVLDQENRLVPIGAPGELCVAGVNVALGYLNRPELNAERFPPHPMDDGQSMYRTGDIVRWLDDGTLELVGRVDDQVKVRGHRVELGEVQAALLSCPGVLQAAVTADQSPERTGELSAYIVSRADLSSAEIRKYLQRTLPEYMIPSLISFLSELPLTTQGKLDRAALPEIYPHRQSPSPTEVSFNPLETKLLDIWREVHGTPNAGVNESFLDLGGHSLTAIRLAVEIRKRIGYEVGVRDIFLHPTVADLALALHGGNTSIEASIPRIPDAPHYAVSAAQHRLWLIHNLGGDPVAYNVSGAFSIQGPVDVEALKRACFHLLARHEALRTTYSQHDGQPRQQLRPPADDTLVSTDVTTASNPHAEAMALFQQLSEQTFDLVHGPLIRMRLVKEGHEHHLLIVVLHHIVADGWSVDIIIRELSALYAAKTQGTDDGLPPLSVQYRDVSAWLNARPMTEHANYWRSKLGGRLAQLELPLDRPRPPTRTFRGTTHRYEIPDHVVRNLRVLARSANATPFMVLVAVVKILLSRYSGQSDILVGHPVAGRDHSDLKDQVGFFVNTIVLRDEVRADQAFSVFLAEIRQTVLEGIEHQAYPFDQLIEELGAVRTPSRHPVFDVMVSYEGSPSGILELPGLQVEPVDITSRTSKFDLLFAFNETAASIHAAIEYSTDVFNTSTVERMWGHLLTLLEAATAAPQTILQLLPMLTGEEHSPIQLGEPTLSATSTDDSLVSRIERAIATCAETTAVVCGDVRLSYRQLDKRTSALARRLVAAGVVRDVPVGLYIDRSVDMLTGIIGILKSGGAYLPLDPSLPPHRLRSMLNDAGATIVVSHTRLASEASPLGARVMLLDSTGSEADHVPLPLVGAVNLAYVMFTSGSTGRPNGVMVEHRNVLALLDAYEKLAPAQAELSGAALCPFGFDVSVWEIFSVLTHAGTLHLLAREDAANGLRLVEYLHKQGISSAYVPPALVDEVAKAIAESGRSSLNRLLVGVEPILQDTLDRLRTTVPGLRIVNGYGPTEATVCATFLLYEGRPGSDTPTPIGTAAAGYEVHILNADMEPVPKGVAGEIFVGGAGLSRGYAGNAPLTAQRFIPNPFARLAGKRLYRTGDLARILADGNIQFLGRRDQQMKLRGMRIEPGEIEYILCTSSAVLEAAVMLQDAPTGDKQLVAYVAGGITGEQVPQLRALLKTKLPEYMIPAAFVAVPSLPRTINGKVDRAALHLPATPLLAPQTAAGPLTATEERLLVLWSEVLQVEHLGCDDDFFELGGHSLLATRLLGRVHEATGIELPLRQLFEGRTIRETAAYLDALNSEKRDEPSRVPIDPVRRDATLRLSYAQERLWFLEQLEPGSAYNVPAILELDGELEPKRLEQAFNTVIDHHEVLRTSFISIDGQPAQEILASRPVSIPCHDLGNLDQSLQSAEVRHRAEALSSSPFDLVNDALVRAILLRLAPQRHVLLLSIHHIVVDGWSMNVLLKDLSASYRGKALARLPLQYADFAAWQRHKGYEGMLARQVDYWRHRLADLPPLLPLPIDHPRETERTRKAAIERFMIGTELVCAVKSRASELQVTPFMMTLAALGALLARTTGQKDIPIGTPIANRTRAELEDQIGFFANTIVVRLDLEDNPSYADLVRRTREATVDAYAHQDAPFEQIVSALQPERSLSHTPLFQVLFIMQHEETYSASLPGLQVRSLPQPATTAKFDLTVALEERNGTYTGAIEYDSSLFDPGTVRSMCSQFHTLLASAVGHPEERVSRLPLLTNAQREDIAERQTGNVAAISEAKTVGGLFAAQVQRTPLSVAIEDGYTKTTYAELDARACRLARHLRKHGAGRNVPVGLSISRNTDALVGLLAIIKVGAGVVPIDPSYPLERQSAMLRDAGVSLLVGMSLRQPADTIGPEHVDLQHIDLQRDAARIAGEPYEALPIENTPDDLFYLLFTSGSTGVPKGVQVPHRVITNLLAWGRTEDDFATPARTLQFTSMSFDVSFQEIFSCWAHGGTLVLIDDERRRDSMALLAFLQQYRIERLFAPYVALQGLAEAAINQPYDCLPTSLKQIVTAGEQLRTTRALVQLFTRLDECRLYNHYGPTETHVVTAHRLSGPPSEWPALPPIGRPLAGVRLYLLDEQQNHVPAGVIGELHVGGVAVASGYINRPGLTAERFLPDPHGDGSLMYRTGDLARHRTDGCYEFCGRADAQIKVRGFRVEPGEIEVALMQHENIGQAVVTLNSGKGQDRLVAHVCPSPGAEINVVELRQHIASLLPEYMIPSAFSILSSIPLTATGKVDRIRLPDAEAAPERQRIPPETATERALAEIFEQVLEVNDLGVTDNFFELGGHSLLATRLISRILGTFGAQLALRSLFEAPTIRELARVIEAANTNAMPEAVMSVERTYPLPLSYAQERLWYLDRLSPGPGYNMPAALRLQGPLNLNALQGAFDAIIERHEVLRTRFVEQAGVPVQCVDTEQAVEIKMISLRSGNPDERAAEVRRLAETQAGTPFELAKGPLLRLTLLDLGQREHVLIIVLHHIIADGWSISVLTRELVAFYVALSRGVPHVLPPLPLQYGDFSCWQRGTQTTRILELQREYWADKLKGAVPAIALPVSRQRVGRSDMSGATVAFELPQELGDAVRVHAQATKTTVYATLLSAFLALLFRISGQSDLTIGTPVGHRPRPEFEPLIGLFLNMLPLRVRCDANMSLAGLCDAVHATALDAFAQGDLPFEQIVNAAETNRESTQSPLFNVVFVMQNAPSTELVLDGIDITPVEFESVVAKYDITLALKDSGGCISGGLEYATDILDLGTAKQLVDAFIEVVNAMTNDPSALLMDRSTNLNQAVDDEDFTF